MMKLGDIERRVSLIWEAWYSSSHRTTFVKEEDQEALRRFAVQLAVDARREAFEEAARHLETVALGEDRCDAVLRAAAGVVRAMADKNEG